MLTYFEILRRSKYPLRVYISHRNLVFHQSVLLTPLSCSAHQSYHPTCVYSYRDDCIFLKDRGAFMQFFFITNKSYKPICLSVFSYIIFLIRIMKYHNYHNKKHCQTPHLRLLDRSGSCTSMLLSQHFLDFSSWLYFNAFCGIFDLPLYLSSIYLIFFKRNYDLAIWIRFKINDLLMQETMRLLVILLVSASLLEACQTRSSHDSERASHRVCVLSYPRKLRFKIFCPLSLSVCLFVYLSVSLSLYIYTTLSLSFLCILTLFVFITEIP